MAPLYNATNTRQAQFVVEKSQEKPQADPKSEENGVNCGEALSEPYRSSLSAKDLRTAQPAPLQTTPTKIAIPLSSCLVEWAASFIVASLTAVSIYAERDQSADTVAANTVSARMENKVRGRL